MKAIGVTRFGGPETLGVVEVPTPEPGPGQVRIRVHAAAVNPTDITFRTGGRAAQLTPRPAPYIPGMDAAGVVEALGSDVDGARFGLGDAVVAYVMPFGPTGGAYAERIVVPAASVVPAPQGASFAESSTLLLNSVTAQLALDALSVSSGGTLAVLGAAGAVGGYLVELAQAHRLRLIATASRGDAKLLRSLGADTILDRREDVPVRIREIVAGGVAGLADCATLDAGALEPIADNGALATFRGWSGPTERGITIHPVSSSTAAEDTVLLDRLARQAEAGVLSLRVAKVLPAAQAADAHRALAAGGVRGRIVLDFSAPL